MDPTKKQSERDGWKSEKFLAQHRHDPADSSGSCHVFGTIAYIITLQDIANSAISYITGLLISVTGILLGLSGVTPASKSLERMKLQVTLTITTLLWLVAVVMIAQTAGRSHLPGQQRLFDISSSWELHSSPFSL